MKKIIPLIVLIFILLAVLLPGMLIKVKILCIDQNSRCNPEIEKDISEANNKSLFNAKKQLKKTLDNSYMIIEYSTQFKLPNILQLNILTKKPSFAIKSENGVFYLVDPTGYVLAKNDQTTLPYIIQDKETYQVGSKVNGQTLDALELVDGIYKMYQINAGVFRENALFADLPGGISVVFPLDGSDRDLLLGSLRLIYSNIKNGEGEQYSQIDMRYKNPVLR